MRPGSSGKGAASRGKQLAKLSVPAEADRQDRPEPGEACAAIDRSPNDLAELASEHIALAWIDRYAG